MLIGLACAPKQMAATAAAIATPSQDCDATREIVATSGGRSPLRLAGAASADNVLERAPADRHDGCEQRGEHDHQRRRKAREERCAVRSDGPRGHGLAGRQRERRAALFPELVDPALDLLLAGPDRVAGRIGGGTTAAAPALVAARGRLRLTQRVGADGRGEHVRAARVLDRLGLYFLERRLQHLEGVVAFEGAVVGVSAVVERGSDLLLEMALVRVGGGRPGERERYEDGDEHPRVPRGHCLTLPACLLYTSDAADDLLCVD